MVAEESKKVSIFSCLKGKVDMSEAKRVIVLTDISTMKVGSGEPDDTQSLIRFLLYANEFDVEGLIATYTSHGECCNPQYIREVLQAYGKVLPKLRKHDFRYPAMEKLLENVKCGSEVVGLEHIGEGQDTEGSDWIIHVVDKEDDRPVWILIWGGPKDLAQAIWKVCHTRSHKEARRFKEKLRIYAISDQYDTTGQWIKERHPDIFYITAGITFRGMYRGGNELHCQPEWVKEHICKGPLGELYPIYDGADPWGTVKGLKEGDSPSFLYLLGNNSENAEDPTMPSWGGQFVQNGNQYYDLPDKEAAIASVSQWRSVYQEDFAKRISWSVE